MTEIRPYAVVRLLSGLPEFGVLPGTLAVVLDVHTEPYEALEVEVADEAGRTMFVGAVEPAQCVLRDELAPGETSADDSTRGASGSVDGRFEPPRRDERGRGAPG